MNERIETIEVEYMTKENITISIATLKISNKLYRTRVTSNGKVLTETINRRSDAANNSFTKSYKFAVNYKNELEENEMEQLRNVFTK